MNQYATNEVNVQLVCNAVADQKIYAKSAPSAIYAVILIACLYVMPSGFVGLVRRMVVRGTPTTTDRE